MSLSTCPRVSSARPRAARTARRWRSRRCRRLDPARTTRRCGSPRRHILEGLVRRGGERQRQRAAERAVRLAGRLEQHAEAELVEQLRLRRLVEHLEAGRDIGLERETGAAGACRRRGWSAPSGRPAFRARANSRRARGTHARRPARSRRSGGFPGRARHRRARSMPSVSKTRFAMLAAAALVKVMQRMCAGSTPSSSRRITRCASTWVLPEPALAATQADTAGSDASICSRVTACGMMRARSWRCHSLGALPSPLRGGVGGGGRSTWHFRSNAEPPPSPTLPQRKSGLPDLRSIRRNPGKPGFRGGGSTPFVRLEHSVGRLHSPPPDSSSSSPPSDHSLTRARWS